MGAKRRKLHAALDRLVNQSDLKNNNDNDFKNDSKSLPTTNTKTTKNPQYGTPEFEKYLEEQTELEFKKINQKSDAEEKKSCPSLHKIPRFFHAKQNVIDLNCTSMNASRLDDLHDGTMNANLDDSLLFDKNNAASIKGVLGVRTKREARQKMLQKRTAELLDEPDLHSLLELLKSNAKIVLRAHSRAMTELEKQSATFSSNPVTASVEASKNVAGGVGAGTSTAGGAVGSTTGSTVGASAVPGAGVGGGAVVSTLPSSGNPLGMENIGHNSRIEVIDYASFRRVYQHLLDAAGNDKELRELCKRKFGPFFTPRSYLKFGSLVAEIGVVPFFSYAVRKVNIKQTRIQLSYYDTIGHGYLREKDLENFVFELIPTLPQLQQLQEEFYPFYVFTAVRKFFFFLDPKRSGKIYIRDLLPSTILPELYELRAEEEKQDSDKNWFSVESALRVYGMYLELDTDQNGMLSPEELSKYGSGMLSHEFVTRVFEEHQTYRDEQGNQEMDYKTFLDFVLAMENKQAKQSIVYLWKLVDMNQTGKIDTFVIRYFFRAIIRTLEQKELANNIRVEDVADEIFDMIRPKNSDHILLDDALRSGMGGTMLSILTDTQAFFSYDNRENMFNDDDEE